LTPTPTQTPTPIHTPGAGGPYAVEQTHSLGGEKISGIVCDLVKPFLVNSTTPKVTFNFVFVPAGVNRGKVTYAYTIPSAGESHDAAGTYTIQPLAGTVKLVLSLTMTDHVVFKGFDGNFPIQYSFNLVPGSNIPCP
jgi:hypothetical protein